uniref:Large ribosomal subunit protein uL5c n=1 Tax=Choreocolax polysiphoniae TaxID=282351 RepID=A0A0B5W395_9FLOR|nr:50S ribosomal protein L5 [Choreocolax polysiphoniae]AJH65860.1 50S ribosomal protein L5 [Choreocolax polysiphoniae]
MINLLKNNYNQQFFFELIKEFKYKNIHEVPKILKIIINRGIKESIYNNKVINRSILELSSITGQKPIITKTKKSIASFKTRKNMEIGLKVTLRKKIMYEFLNKLINLSLPRIKDFRGIDSKQFDGRGNYNLGLQEQLVFPEINYEQVDKIRGMNITIVTTANNDEEGLALLKKFGMPFKI